MMQKSGIALLITLLFIIAITVAIGIGFKEINKANQSAKQEHFLIQTNILLDDVMHLLQNNKDIDIIVKQKSPEMLYLFLSQSAFLPLESSGIKMLIEIHSARAKFNPNTMVTPSGHINHKIEEALKVYLARYNINESYVDMMIDMMSKVKPDMSYNTDIFQQKPYLFRDYIVSQKHLDEITDTYIKIYKNNDINKVDFTKLFYFTKERTSYTIDLNYATTEVWQLLLDCDRERAKELSQKGGSYTKLQDVGLSEEEKSQLARFKTGFFQPILDVFVEIIQNNQDIQISFEYNMQTKKGSNFRYEF